MITIKKCEQQICGKCKAKEAEWFGELNKPQWICESCMLTGTEWEYLLAPEEKENETTLL